MKKYTKIYVFDFDKTMCHTPEPETGRDVWEKATGLSFQGRGWWGNAESLNTDIFYIPVNDWVYKKYLEVINDENAYVILCTGRLIRLETHVRKILKNNELEFHDVFCNTGGETFNFKKYLFEKIIKENPDAVEFTMYDDRHEHLGKFVEWAKIQPIKVNVIDVINKKQLY